MFNIVDEIFSRADRGAVALISNETTLSYGDLERLTQEAADALAVAPGQRVGLHCPNGIPHIVWSLAVLKRQGVLVPIAPELSHPERDQVVETTSLDIVLCADGNKWHREAPSARTLQVGGIGEAVLSSGWKTKPAGFHEDRLVALNPALIRFSSGTTGKRKGIVLSHETLFARVTASNAGLKVGPGDRVIWILPMAHHFAVSIILYLLHGAATVVETSHLGDDVFKALEKHQGTMLYASPFHYALLGACAEAHAVPGLRLAVSTAAALPPATGEKFFERFNVPLNQALGIIECGLPIFNDLWPREKPESVGRPQSAYATAIRRTDGSEAAIDEVGELFIKGPGITDAYLSPWTPQAEILEDGWFRTGDQARRDADGAIFLSGRSKSVINVGGMKCFPEEIEATLNEHAAVKESRVFGLPHPTFGSVPVAEIVPADPAAPPKMSELAGYCRQRLSNYKIPVKYTFVSELPKTPSGKILRQ